MLNKDSHLALQDDFDVGNKNYESEEEDYQATDKSRLDSIVTSGEDDNKYVVTVGQQTNDGDWDQDVDNDLDGKRREQLQLAVLCWLFLEKFVETVIVFCLTILVLVWTPAFSFIQTIMWPLIGYVVLSLIALCGLRLLPWCRRYPGCFVPKLIYILFLIDAFFLMAIHVPIHVPSLSSYFALVAAGTAASNYLLLAFIVVTHKHICKVDAKGCGLSLYGLLIPLSVLAVSQPIFLYGGVGRTLDYRDFMTNIAAGLVISIIVSYETLLIDQRFVNSSKLEKFVTTPGLLPTFVTALSRQPNGDRMNGGAENKLFLFQI